MRVKGYAAKDAKSVLAPFEFERRTPKPTDVSIDVDYCGICHSDIHTARNEWGGTLYPCVPGHEVVGKVVAVGEGVTRFQVGETVGVGCLVNSCQSCSSCKAGLQSYCERGFTGTYNGREESGHTFGGYSTHMVVNQDFVLKVPTQLDQAACAPLLCAGITTYSPMRHVGVSKGDKVGVVGLGGLGHMGVKIAASLGAEVTVFSRTADKKADAQRLGASNFIVTSSDAEVNKHKNHFDYILDTVSAKHDVNQLLGCVKREGTLIMVGASEKPLDLSVFSLILNRRSILGSLIGGIPETQEMLDHCGKHNITSDIELIEPNKINDAYERTVNGQVRYRFVIDCKKF